MINKFILLSLSLLLLMSCKAKLSDIDQKSDKDLQNGKYETEVSPPKADETLRNNFKAFKKEGWKELDESLGFIVDIKYASEDNFTKKKIYDCGRCFLRESAADALIKINEALAKIGDYKIKLFDCYRPSPYQQRLWDVVPDPKYVMPPNKGSMHSRGLAVDLTLTDAKGDELDMGTPFDFFGPEAHTDRLFPDAQVQHHRNLLQSLMKNYGFEGIRTEWWHFSLREKNAELAGWLWPCE